MLYDVRILAFIKKFEGFSSKTYYCEAGVLTIGYGTTKKYLKLPDGKWQILPIEKSMRVNEEQALELMKAEVDFLAEKFDKFLEDNAVLLNKDQFSALLSLGFNSGIGYLTSSKYSLSNAIASDNLALVIQKMKEINKIKKCFLGVCWTKELRGLTRRRNAEIEIFKGNWEVLKTI